MFVCSWFSKALGSRIGLHQQRSVKSRNRLESFEFLFESLLTQSWLFYCGHHLSRSWTTWNSVFIYHCIAPQKQQFGTTQDKLIALGTTSRTPSRTSTRTPTLDTPNFFSFLNRASFSLPWWRLQFKKLCLSVSCCYVGIPTSNNLKNVSRFRQEDLLKKWGSLPSLPTSVICRGCWIIIPISTRLHCPSSSLSTLVSHRK